MKRKLLAILLSVLFLCAAVPLGAVAVAAAYSGTTGECTWTLEGTHLTISGNGAMGDYYYSGGQPRPWDNDITSVIIEDGVTSIGEEAFASCVSLTSVTIPDSVTVIEYGAFSSCTALETVTIPGSVTVVRPWAFADCSSLTQVTIEEGVTSIGQGVFSSCSSLTSITIPNSVTSIGSLAFYKCTSLVSIVLSDHVTTINYGMVSGCSSLTDVYYGGSEASRDNIDVGQFNDELLNVTWHYHYTPEPTTSSSAAQSTTSAILPVEDKTTLSSDGVTDPTKTLFSQSEEIAPTNATAQNTDGKAEKKEIPWLPIGISVGVAILVIGVGLFLCLRKKKR